MRLSILHSHHRQERSRNAHRLACHLFGQNWGWAPAAGDSKGGGGGKGWNGPGNWGPGSGPWGGDGKGGKVLRDFNKTDAIMDHIERNDAEAVVIVPEHTSKQFWCRIWSAAWLRRVARWEFLSGEVLEPHKENADECFFGTRFNCRVLLMVVRLLDDSTRRAAPPDG